jgi:mycofactocin system glycosyltransferase
VYDDPASLATCLFALGNAVDITVVDDGSVDGEAVAAVAAVHRARLVRRPRNGGPAAARNQGAAVATADVIAFVDCDAAVTAADLARLTDHFSDPDVAAVAPRVRGTSTAAGTLAALARWWSPLDMGAAPALVHRRGAVGYVPSTVLLVRREQLRGVGGFDESLRYGEDVDLIWRLRGTGASVRYDPTVHVRHAEPATWRQWLRRRARYGTSAGALSRRHPDGPVTLSLRPAPAGALVLMLARRPLLAAAVAAASAGRLQQRLRAADVPAHVVGAGAVAAPVHAGVAAARWLTQIWWPALAAVALSSRRVRRQVAVVAVVPPLVEWVRRRPRVDPLRWVVGVLLDDAAYGVGVWRGCVRDRTIRPLLPHVR